MAPPGNFIQTPWPSRTDCSFLDFNASFESYRKGYCAYYAVSFLLEVLFMQTNGLPFLKTRPDTPAGAVCEFLACE